MLSCLKKFRERDMSIKLTKLGLNSFLSLKTVVDSNFGPQFDLFPS
jgi:hypothetical protein